MTSDERTQAAALNRFVNFGYHARGWRFAQHLDWLRRNEPDTVLSGRQKYFLASLCHRYRRQLAGRLVEHLIPTEPPAPDEYFTEPVELQGDLLSGEFTPHETDEDLPPADPDPQRSLF